MNNGFIEVLVILAVITTKRWISFFNLFSFKFGMKKAIIFFGLHSPVLTVRYFTSSQFCFLHVFTVFDKRTFSSVNHISWSGLFYHHTAMQDHFTERIIKPEVKVIVDPCMWSLHADISHHCSWKSE